MAEDVEKCADKQEKKIATAPPPTDYINLIDKATDINEIKSQIIIDANSILEESKLKDKYLLLFIYDDSGQITRYTADRIYNALSGQIKEKKDILLVVHSLGGRIEPAYLLSKCCKELSKEKFLIAVPRQAKSAATLLALGADEIHMGFMSELGPIDPQVGDYPAIGLSYAVEYLAEVASRYPRSNDMFAKYLTQTLDLSYLGFLGRITESAIQYAERLLKDKGLDANLVARKLVLEYKDHGFVIDKEEAKSLLGDKIIKTNTEEYRLANSFHKLFEFVNIVSKGLKKYNFTIVGKLEDNAILFNKVKDKYGN